MTCNMDEKFLYDYEDGTIDPLEKIFVEEHIKHCNKCKKQLKIIKTIENGLKAAPNKTSVPDKLSVISQMVAENCITRIENEDPSVRRRNYKENMKALRSVIINTQFLQNNNPYNKAVKKCIKVVATAAEKPAKDYIKKKMSKFNVFKMLKVG